MIIISLFILLLLLLFVFSACRLASICDDNMEEDYVEK